MQDAAVDEVPSTMPPAVQAGVGGVGIGSQKKGANSRNLEQLKIYHVFFGSARVFFFFSMSTTNKNH